MATETDEPRTSPLQSIMDELPLDRLKDEAKQGAQALSQWALQSATSRITDLTSKFDSVGDGGVAKEAAKGAVEDSSPVKGAVKGGLRGAFDSAKDKIGDIMPGGSSGSGGKEATRSTNIIEEIDIGLPVDVVYNQWTQLQDFPRFMKKVESVEQESDEKVTFQAQVLWSHRTWDATIIEQVPDELIVWRSTGEKGHVDGAVTFHELAPRLTRVIVVLEYYPKGFFERTGNIWRAQGRRARLELKHFRRHVMMNLLPDPDQVEGWRGEIHDSEVVAGHGEAESDQESVEDEAGEEYEDEPADDEFEDEAAEEEYEDEPEDEELEDEAAEDEEEPIEDEADEEPPRRRRRSTR